MKHNILVLSDLHLGGHECNTSKLIDVLKEEQSDILIINGDLFDSRHLHRLNKEQWKVLNLLRKISKHTKVILIMGNHDFYDAEILTHLLGFEVQDHLLLSVNNKTYFFIHGHIFDFVMTRMKWLTHIVSEIYYHLCRNKFIRQKLNLCLHADKHILKSDVKMKRSASSYKKQKHADWIVCGHSHYAEIDVTCGYINSGTFCSDNPTYVTVDDLGIPTLRTV